MKADVTIPVCPCGGTRVRVSTQPVYRCPDCGDTIHRRRDEWQQRGEKSAFSAHKSPPAYHVKFTTVGLAAPPARPKKFHLDYPYRRTASGKAI
jgi:predicted RNA-binding Zn-ribbon protein involved in translation (DUF1610 family)